MAKMKEYPKIDELFSANSEKLIPEDKERIVVEYMADITANAAGFSVDSELLNKVERQLIDCVR